MLREIQVYKKGKIYIYIFFLFFRLMGMLRIISVHPNDGIRTRTLCKSHAASFASERTRHRAKNDGVNTSVVYVSVDQQQSKKSVGEQILPLNIPHYARESSEINYRLIADMTLTNLYNRFVP